MRNRIISLAACALLCVAAYASEADSSAPVADNAIPDGTVTLKGGSVGVSVVDVGADQLHGRWGCL